MAKKVKIVLVMVFLYIAVMYVQKLFKSMEELKADVEEYKKGIDYLKEKLKLEAGEVDSLDNYAVINVNGIIWMTSNLNTDTFANGDYIPEVREESAWLDLDSGAWCYYDNNPAMGDKYDRIYNWYAVGDERGLCPCGWEVASDQDWQDLVAYYGGKYASVYYLNSDSGWCQKGLSANASGFNALPGGYRPTHLESGGTNNDFDGRCGGVWWSSTEGMLILDKYVRNKTAYGMDLNLSDTYRANNAWYVGQYVRCVKQKLDKL